MPRLLFLCGILAAIFSGATAQADLVLTVDNQTFTANSGVQMLDIFVRTTTADEPIALTADFVLQDGVFEEPPGEFGEPGFVGEGNLANSSNFTTFSATGASLSLDFLSPQTIPTNDSVVARIEFDVDGLAAGTYSVTLDNLFALGDTNNSIPVTGNAGSFTISAVPEPNSALLLSSLTLVGFARRRWRC